MHFNLPMALTWLRIIVIPLFLLLFFVPHHWLAWPLRDSIAAVIFILAAVTDWFDGWLARRWRQTTAFGAFLDPVADKLMVTAALLILLYLGRLDPVVSFIIIGREITISALREWMAKLGASDSVAVHWLGKVKTAAQMISIPCLLYAQPLYGISLFIVGQVLIVIAAILTLWSMFYYLRKAWPELVKKGV